MAQQHRNRIADLRIADFSHFDEFAGEAAALDLAESYALSLLAEALRAAGEAAARGIAEALAASDLPVDVTRAQLRRADETPPGGTAAMTPDVAAAVYMLETVRRLCRASVPSARDDELGERRASFAEQELPALTAPIRWLESALLAPTRDYWDSLSFVDPSTYEAGLRVNAARPFAELARCWWEGIARAEQPAVEAHVLTPTWSEYLLRSAGPLRLTIVHSTRQLHLVGQNSMLQRFDQVYGDEEFAGLFATPGGRLQRPSRGRRRRDRPTPQMNDVVAWVCDGRAGPHRRWSDRCFSAPDSPIANSTRRYRLRPPSESELWADIDHQLDRFAEEPELQLPARATQWDRRVCPDYRECGGVLVPASAAWVDHQLAADRSETEARWRLKTWDERRVADPPPNLVVQPAVEESA